MNQLLFQTWQPCIPNCVEIWCDVVTVLCWFQTGPSILCYDMSLVTRLASNICIAFWKWEATLLSVGYSICLSAFILKTLVQHMSIGTSSFVLSVGITFMANCFPSIESRSISIYFISQLGGNFLAILIILFQSFATLMFLDKGSRTPKSSRKVLPKDRFFNKL